MFQYMCTVLYLLQLLQREECKNHEECERNHNNLMLLIADLLLRRTHGDSGAVDGTGNDYQRGRAD